MRAGNAYARRLFGRDKETRTKLAGKKAIIFDPDSGIGQATAELFAREGADLVISYHTDEAGIAETKRKVEALGRKAEVVFSDVGDPASVKALFAKAEAVFGHSDLLVANAGIAMSGMLVEELDDDMLERVLRVNLMGAAFCARAFVRARKAAGGKGRLVFIGSVAGHLPTPGVFALRHVQGRRETRSCAASR